MMKNKCQSLSNFPLMLLCHAVFGLWNFIPESQPEFEITSGGWRIMHVASACKCIRLHLCIFECQKTVHVSSHLCQRSDVRLRHEREKRTPFGIWMTYASGVTAASNDLPHPCHSVPSRIFIMHQRPLSSPLFPALSFRLQSGHNIMTHLSQKYKAVRGRSMKQHLHAASSTSTPLNLMLTSSHLRTHIHICMHRDWIRETSL